MRPITTLKLMACMVLVCTANLAYFKSASDINTRSTFVLPILDATTVVSALIDLQGAGLSYNVQLWAPLSFPPNSPFQSARLSGTARFVGRPLTVPGSWRLVVTPVSPSDPKFMFTINIFANNQTIGKFVDVARYYRYFTLFHTAAAQRTVTLNVPPSMAGQATLNLYGPFQSLTFAGGSQSTAAASDSGVSTLTYFANAREFYFIQIVQSARLTLSGNSINVKYDSDQFQCPFSSEFSDYNGVFAGCSNILPTYGFPCINYDTTVGTCNACANTWTLDRNGVCIQDTSCPRGQFFSLGRCLKALPNCRDFQLFGGRCRQCESGFTLNSYFNGTQACTRNAEACSSNQYLLGNVCMNYVDGCGNFQSSTGQCLACKPGFILTQNRCVRNQVRSIDCQLGFRAVDGECQPVDSNCIFYFPNNTCMLCGPGFLLRQKCEKLVCGARQYSSTGQCLDVSPFCRTFDPIYGNCLTCIYPYFLQAGGTCKQAIPSQGGVISVNSCPENYYMRQGTCVAVNPLCLTYDVDTGLCTSCRDSGYFLNAAGVCILIEEYCGYRTYFDNGNCLPVSPLCDAFDYTTGYCTTCRDSTILGENGTCVYNDPCKERQYRARNGTCLDVSADCVNFDPSSGFCTSCHPNYELNPGGTCCYQLNYLLSRTCAAQLGQNCQNQHDRFGYCLKCRAGFSQKFGIFGRCAAIQ